MKPERKCPKCGGPLADNLAAGLCPKCLVQMSLGREHNDEALPPSDTPAGQPLPGAPDGQTLEMPVVLPLSEQPGDRIGRYKLLEKLGEGGMGTVWLAEQTEPVHRKVALKVVKAGMDSAEVLARFDAERQALALMDHPSIAKVLDAGATLSGRPYFVMELVKGTPITRFCDEQRLPVKERLDLFRMVCQAVQHAHQKGIIHRDIKPSNVMVTLSDGKPVPKVIDFGIAKAMGPRLTDRTLHTLQGVLLGTPAYMSPEQAKLNSLDIDTRSDIYSLGVLLYELLTGSTPLTKETLHQAAFEEVLRLIRELDPPKPSTRLTQLGAKLATISTQRKLEPRKLSREIQGDLDWIVMKALEKDRNRRYETANAFAQDIEHHLNNEPVQAGPPTARYRLKKFVQRHRIAAAIAALLVGASIVSTSLALWANRERNIANQQREAAVKAQTAAARAKGEAEKEAKRADANAKQEAEQRQQVERSLTLLELREAESLFAQENPSGALAILARSLRRNSTNHVVASRALSALIHRANQGLAIPMITITSAVGSVRFAQYSPDGRWVVTTSSDRTARVWDAQSGTAISKPMVHGGKVLFANFSPTARQVVTASGDETARIWDARTGQPLSSPLKHQGAVLSAQFSADGERVVTASEDFTARVWDVHSGRPLTNPIEHQGPVISAQFSPDGRWVVALVGFVSQNIVMISDSQTGQPIRTLPHKEYVAGAHFSADGQRLVTASNDGSARVWDLQTGQLLHELKHQESVASAQFSPDGQRIITASSDRTTLVWDVQSGKPLTKPLRHSREVSYASFSPDGRRLVTVAADNTARLWDAQSEQPVAVPIFHKGRINSAQFSPDGRWLLTASEDGTARISDASAAQPVTEALREDCPVDSAHYSSDGHRLVTISSQSKRSRGSRDDFTVRVWDASNRELLLGPLRHQGFINHAELSPDNRWIVTASSDGNARIWDARTGQLATDPMPHRGMVLSACFSPDGQRVVTRCLDPDGIPLSYAQVWASRTGKPITKQLLTKDNWGLMGSALFSPNGRLILTSGLTESSDSRAQIFDAETGQALFECKSGEITQLSHDGRFVLARLGNAAEIWDAQTGQMICQPLKHNDKIYGAKFSPDGRFVVTASADGTARVWDARTGRPLSWPLKHQQAVNSAEFSANGLRVVTASSDKTARVWDVQTSQPLTEPLMHPQAVLSAQWHSDGQVLMTVSLDKQVRLWNIPQVTNSCPELFIRMLEVISSQRYDDTGNTEIMSYGLREFIKQIPSNLETNAFAKCIQWISTDYQNKSLTPYSQLTVDEYVKRCIDDSTMENLLEATLMSPTNAFAFARLATMILAQDERQNPRRCSEAAFYSQWALKWAPDSPELRRIVSEIGASIEQTSNVRFTNEVPPTGKQPSEVITSQKRANNGSADKPRNPQWTNGLGMVFVSVQKSNVLFCVWETRVKDFRAFVGATAYDAGNTMVILRKDGLRSMSGYNWENPGFKQTEDHPVVGVNWDDAHAFCRWLTELELRSGRLKAGQRYRLPTDDEWSLAAGTNKYIWGNEWPPTRIVGNHAGSEVSDSDWPTAWRAPAGEDDGYARTAPVGSYYHNLYGICDLSGNVQEMCEDWYRKEMNSAEIRKENADLNNDGGGMKLRVARGSSWLSGGFEMLLLTLRHPCSPNGRDAIKGFRCVLELAADTNSVKIMDAQALLTQSDMNRHLGRLFEAGQQYCQAKGFPVRGANGKTNLIDLSLFYNASLDANWHVRTEIGNDLSNLPHGLNKISGTEFDLRGVIQLSSSLQKLRDRTYPEEIKNVPIGLKCQRLHFLQATGWDDPDGKQVATYTIHWQNGENLEIPIVYGEDLRGWWPKRDEKPLPEKTVVAWGGTNAMKAPIRLFKNTWQNPKPELEIKSLDLKSAMSRAAPFVIAITAE